MRLPRALLELLEKSCGERVRHAEMVGGGCISNTTRIELASGTQVFLKWARTGEQPASMFTEEARALRAIAQTHTVRVPAVLECGQAEGYNWLLLEWLEPGSGSTKSQHVLGEQLAALHRHGANEYGWPSDNFIGSLPQSNRRHGRWAQFWRDERLLPQLALAAPRLDQGERRRLEQVCAACDDLLAGTDADGPGLLHGDLWSGNVHMLADGTPALVDPSSYYGHREVDLAMARLFGGFTEAFFGGYERAWPCMHEADARVRVYQVYYLLVHVNLFGGAYRAQTMTTVAELGF